MKKVLVLIVLAVSAMTSMAQSIPQEILGVKIGETMQEDAHNILIEQDLEYDWKYEDTYYYRGEFKYEGIEWSEIRLTFANNKLSGCPFGQPLNLFLSGIDLSQTAFAGFTEAVIKIDTGFVHSSADHIVADVTGTGKEIA